MPTFYPEQVDYLTKLNALSDGDLANEAIATGVTKTVNIGTAGLSGSTTDIKLGSAVTGATNDLGVNGLFNYRTYILSTTTTAADQIIAQIPIATFRSVKFYVQVTSGSNYRYAEIPLLHNGTTVYQVGALNATATAGITLINSITVTGDPASTFKSTIVSGNLRLLSTPISAVTVYKVVARLIVV